MPKILQFIRIYAVERGIEPVTSTLHKLFHYTASHPHALRMLAKLYIAGGTVKSTPFVRRVNSRW